MWQIPPAPAVDLPQSLAARLFQGALPLFEIGSYNLIWIAQTKLTTMIPTDAAYSELQQAFDFFNKRLFDGILPPCLLTLQRQKRTYGYFSRKRFISHTGELTDEIAMNPAYFGITPLIESAQTLVHEMVHQWQFHFGNPSRRGYHNKEWSIKMQSVGLMPSSTGQPGGKKTGEKMSDYVIPDGPFERLFNELAGSGFTITWRDRQPIASAVQQIISTVAEGGEAELLEEIEALGIEVIPPEAKATRRKFSCAGCKANIWGKPGIRAQCLDCDLPFVDSGT